MARGDILVRVLGDTKDLERKLNGIGGKTSGLSKIGSVAKASAVGLAAVGSAAAFGAKKAFDAYGEAQAVAAQTAAVIKSTGGAAGKSAKDFANLATELSKTTAFDDEVIQSSENMLATFTNLRNGVGKGNDVFDQATVAVLDMSQALGKDTKASALQLGKALNDPIKGVTALGRAGVQFTEQQKDQIKALVDSGKTMEAQKLILAEVQKEFGGSAAAFAKTGPGALKQLQTQLGNVLEDIGKELSPILKEVIDAIRPLIPVLGQALGSVVKALAPILGVIVKAFASLLPVLAPLIEALGAALLPIFKALLPAIAPIIKAIGDGLIEALVAATPALVEIALLVADLLVALAPLLPPILQLTGQVLKLMALALKPLAAVLRAVLVPIIRVLVTVIASVLRWFTNLGSTAKSVGRAIASVWGGIKNGVKAAVGFIKDRFDDVVSFFKGLPERIGDAVAGIWDGLVRTFKGAINVLIDAWNRLDFGIDIRVPKWVPGIGGKGFSVKDVIPDIPRLAAGGIVDRPTLAMIGEAGREAVVPLSRNGSLGGNTYNVNVTVAPGASPAEVGRQTVAAIQAFEKRSGKGWRAA